MRYAVLAVVAFVVITSACASDPQTDAALRADATADAADSAAPLDSTTPPDASPPDDTAGPDAAPPDAPPDAPPSDASTDAGRGTLGSNRDRLLATYLAFLRMTPDTQQTNGLRGRDLPDVCTLWGRLDPSSRATFLTITARLQGSRLGVDGSAALDHVTRLYRAVGGQGATATSAGSCGGGEYNRLMMSMDATLQSTFVAANMHRGASLPSGGYDLADIHPGSPWRDSHDSAGPHAPFTQSDETNDGAPRGQVQYFADPTSARAMMPLGRTDLSTLVDPLALEMDEDYDCVHNSNPLCDYVLYGPLCAPQPMRSGVAIFGANYGAVDLAWHPSGC